MSPLLKRALPIAVSIAVLAWLFGSVDFAKLAAALNWQVAGVMIAAVTLYAAVTLLLESLSIMTVIGSPPEDFGAWTAARIKCASYLLGIVNYALGAGALAVLLRRRAALGLGEAASLVLLISSTDLMVVLVMAGLGTGLVETGAPTLQAGVLVGALVAFVGGLAILRMPRSLGALDRLRSLSIFEGLRTVPMDRLLRLLGLRILFTSSFVGICASSFLAFRHGYEAFPPAAELVVGVLVVGVVAGVPVAVAGLGTSQAAFLFIFAKYASQETLLAQSLVLSTSMLLARALMGLVFAREFTQEALRETRGAAV